MTSRLSPPQKVALGYLTITLIGTLFLLLPWSRQTEVSFTDAFFTSTSALCVTGLSTVTTATTWTVFGKIVIACLMQIGGAGMTLITTSIYLALGRKITVKDRILIAEDRNFGVRGAVRLIKAIMYFSFGIEGSAALLFMLYFHFRYHYPWVRALGFSLFHSISAFNNAGFDLWGNSLENFPNDPFVLLLTSLLIILGGLGFIVLTELYNYPRVKTFSLHTKIVLGMTGLLLAIGTVLIFLFESNYSMSHLSFGSKLLNSWFTSVTTRTAGFDSISIGEMKDVTWFIIIILMFIGASPGSTGGGIKTTTFYILLKSALANARGDSEICVGERSISWEVSQRALLIFFLASSVVATAVLIDAALEPHINLLRILFEEVSAFGTVGLTTGITSQVNTAVKWVLIITMYIGRVGILTLLVGMLHRRQRTKVKRISERVFIG
ncbi:MAG: TrkH family potassium uptake protein [Alicyclobacillus herbarius]|uniref:TrkH family potassium uptake protein n=1 Tax=Alicyclobacillus herbarius TaxID=122960 RepID=UPI0023540DA9|nr:TrkH family potassium uptake protein [Alicyclobacillus herbarius]MCL6631953.1 TrkH family potassium uptake protein [Alicyclobacillus herbarius]